MPQQVRGVVARAKGEPVSIETLVIPDPGPGEVVVAVQACGVCHTDLHYREGGIGDEFPSMGSWDPSVWRNQHGGLAPSGDPQSTLSKLMLPVSAKLPLSPPGAFAAGSHRYTPQ